MKLLSLKVETFFPFLDNELFDFVMSCPTEMKLSHRLREDMVASRYAELAHVPVTRYTDRRGRKIGWGYDRRYIRQRRAYFLQNLRRHYFGMNWAFNNVQAGPRLAKDLAMHCTGKRHISYVFSEGFSTFFDWLAHYFPDGVE
jgi:hypothetical protein